MNDDDYDIDDAEVNGKKKKKTADESLPIVREVTVMGGGIVQKTINRKVRSLFFEILSIA